MAVLRWSWQTLAVKSRISNIGAALKGNGSAAELVGVFFTDNDQRINMYTLSDHIGLSTNAETMVKGVLNR